MNVCLCEGVARSETIRQGRVFQSMSLGNFEIFPVRLRIFRVFLFSIFVGDVCAVNGLGSIEEIQ